MKALSAKLADNLQLLKQLETDAATAKEYKSAAETEKSAVSVTVRAARTTGGGGLRCLVPLFPLGSLAGKHKHEYGVALPLCMQDTLRAFIASKFGNRTPCHPTSTAPECGVRTLQKAYRDMCVTCCLNRPVCEGPCGVVSPLSSGVLATEQFSACACIFFPLTLSRFLLLRCIAALSS
jgi:hypothetical protein